MGFKLNY